MFISVYIPVIVLNHCITITVITYNITVITYNITVCCDAFVHLLQSDHIHLMELKMQP